MAKPSTCAYGFGALALAALNQPRLNAEHGKRFGLRMEPTRIYGRRCLVACRLVEREVPFIKLTCPAVGADRWDQHANLQEGHENNARAVDQPIAALLEDLTARGLLETTIVLWAGEFGHTPFAQGSNGRDHNPFGFSIWLAGGGFRRGMAYGADTRVGMRSGASLILRVHSQRAGSPNLAAFHESRRQASNVLL